jgi:hypothetical protein
MAMKIGIEDTSTQECSYQYSTTGEIEKTNKLFPDEYRKLMNELNGFSIKWKAKSNEQIYGQVHFMQFEYVDVPPSKRFDEEQIAENDLLEYFYVFDHVSPELEGLNFDYAGYTKLLMMTKGYKNWPMILIALENDDHIYLISDIQRDMLQAFPEFNWDEFVELYHSVKLN